MQALLQEREITYRNLLAAYLRLQEVNRQKTVFLASAAHELKTPLAVIKGYYDLLLLGSLGKLNDKQREILQESKDSCERLVRLVSMFLNYSALETGKLLLHSRENDLKDCLTEVDFALAGGFPAQARAPGSLAGSADSGVPVRLSEGAAGGRPIWRKSALKEMMGSRRHPSSRARLTPASLDALPSAPLRRSPPST